MPAPREDDQSDIHNHRAIRPIRLVDHAQDGLDRETFESRNVEQHLLLTDNEGLLQQPINVISGTHPTFINGTLYAIGGKQLPATV